jgi:hypothetical protein
VTVELWITKLEPDVPGESSATISFAVVIVELWIVSLAPFVKWIVHGTLRLAVWCETVTEFVSVAEPNPLLSCAAEQSETIPAKLVIPLAALLTELSAISDAARAAEVVSSAMEEMTGVFRLILII